jgi:hypothetical protein
MLTDVLVMTGAPQVGALSTIGAEPAGRLLVTAIIRTDSRQEELVLAPLRAARRGRVFRQRAHDGHRRSVS